MKSLSSVKITLFIYAHTLWLQQQSSCMCSWRLFVSLVTVTVRKYYPRLFWWRLLSFITNLHSFVFVPVLLLFLNSSFLPPTSTRSSPTRICIRSVFIHRVRLCLHSTVSLRIFTYILSVVGRCWWNLSIWSLRICKDYASCLVPWRFRTRCS